MRLRSWVGLGALLLAGQACGDAMAPPGGEGRDLEFFAPDVRAEARRLEGAAFDESKLPPEAQQRLGALRRSNMTIWDPNEPLPPDDESAYIPMILSPYLAGAISGEFLLVRLGAFMFGSGYRASGTVEFHRDGERVATTALAGKTEFWPFYYYMSIRLEEPPIRLPASCGLDADVKAQFEAYTDVLGLNGPFKASTQSMLFSSTAQARCPEPPADGGGGGTIIQERSGIYICYYEVWVDRFGTVIDVYPLGCVDVGGQYAE